jgi:hypothetical protein
VGPPPLQISSFCLPKGSLHSLRSEKTFIDADACFVFVVDIDDRSCGRGDGSGGGGGSDSGGVDGGWDRPDRVYGVCLTVDAALLSPPSSSLSSAGDGDVSAATATVCLAFLTRLPLLTFFSEVGR